MTPTITWTGEFTSPEAIRLKQAFDSAEQNQHKLSNDVITMNGMSGRKYRMLINNLVENTPNARYLEIGSWKGSTACSAIYGNTATATCIDNFTFGGFSKDDLVNNINNIMTSNINFNLIDNDFRAVDYSSIGKYNLYMFDGPHAEQDQYDGVAIVQQALEDRFLLIVDDYNDPNVQRGTQNAIQSLGLTVEASLEIITTYGGTFNENSDWHLGYFIAVIKKG
jgi:Methyltransferase domain